MLWTDLLAAASIGLLGGLHCLGMCGSVVGALTMALPPTARSGGRRWLYVLCYNLGRIASYGLIGVLAGLLGHGLAQGPAGLALRLLAAVMLLLLAAHLAGWTRPLNWLEARGQRLWQVVQPLSRRLFPIQHPLGAFVLGALWGWLPCGLIYSTLVWAMASGNAWLSGAKMLAFGLGTLPALLLVGSLAERFAVWARRTSVKRLAALLLAVYALVSGYQALLHSSGGHQHHQPLPDAPLSGETRPNTEPMHSHHHHH